MKCYCQGYGEVEVLDSPIKGGSLVKVKLSSGAETSVHPHQLALPAEVPPEIPKAKK